MFKLLRAELQCKYAQVYPLNTGALVNIWWFVWTNFIMGHAGQTAKKQNKKNTPTSSLNATCKVVSFASQMPSSNKKLSL